MDIKIVLIGAGSQEFGPASIRDVLLSDVLAEANVHLVLMDIKEETLEGHKTYTENIAKQLNRELTISTTNSLDEALEGADYVISAIELDRYFFWSQDFHIPRKYGFKQVYGENGGPGGIFHALRNFEPTTNIVEAIKRNCPDALLLNYTNPLPKLTQLISTHSDVKTIGLCHGVVYGKLQLARLLEMDVNDIEAYASGLNHFTWFESIRHKSTGEDLYPLLKEKEHQANWLSDWDEIALSRILFRTYGLFPSPGTNHIGEYVRWAAPLLSSSRMQYFYDPKTLNPWESNDIPPYLYNLNVNPTHLPLHGKMEQAYYDNQPKDESIICGSGELAIPIIEGLSFGIKHELAAINIRNDNSLVPGLDEETVIEVPATVDENGLQAIGMKRLPEGPLALLRTQASINKLLVQAYHEKSRDVLLQALMLDPYVDSYHNVVHMINEFFETQKDYLPPLEWSGKN